MARFGVPTGAQAAAAITDGFQSFRDARAARDAQRRADQQLQFQIADRQLAEQERKAAEDQKLNALGAEAGQTVGLRNVQDQLSQQGGLNDVQVGLLNTLNDPAAIREQLMEFQAENAAANAPLSEKDRLALENARADIALKQQKTSDLAKPEVRDQFKVITGADLGITGPDADIRFSQNVNTGKVTAIGNTSQTPKAPSGFRVTAEGDFEPVPGGPADPNLEANKSADQVKSQGFTNRAIASHEALLELDAPTTGGAFQSGVGDLLTAATDALNMNSLGPALESNILSDTEQRRKTLKADFVTAVLRKESGAAIGDDEFAREETKFFPQPGDTAETIAVKREARARAIENLNREAGNSAIEDPSAGEPLDFGALSDDDLEAQIAAEEAKAGS